MDDSNQEVEGKNGIISGWSMTRVLGLILIIGAAVVALYIVVAYLAWQSGQAIRSEREENQLVEQLDRQVSLAQNDISQGSYNLALRRLEWILARDPENADAQAIKLQAEAALKTALTPEAPPTVSPPVEPSPTPGQIGAPDVAFERLQGFHEQESWQELLASTLVFQQQYPAYERLETDRFLYDAYVNLGLEYVQDDAIELGINYFSQAEKLGDLPQEALDYWLWAELHLQGMGYYGVNWGVAASFFRDLCVSAPFYQGSCDKLYDSLVAYGDQYLLAQDYCPAADLYREARQYGRSGELDEKLTEAVQGCADATPTPQAITDTLPATGTGSIVPPGTDE